MPSRNVVKVYVKGGVYHIYNRGVAKSAIFNDKQDFAVFLSYLKEALTKPSQQKTIFSLRGRTFKAVRRLPKNFYQQVNLLAYCLMPNHFHFLIKQNDAVSITSFIRSIINRYAKYFNKKYNRVGPLFQGKYKAALVDKENYLLHLTRYIHLNPFEPGSFDRTYSSYPEYLGIRKTKWIKPDAVLSFFTKSTIPELNKINSYKDFVEKYKTDSATVLGELTLE